MDVEDRDALVKELRLRQRKLPVNGTRSELQTRLLAHLPPIATKRRQLLGSARQIGYVMSYASRWSAQCVLIQ
jgi:hypothetical protein